MFRRQSKKGFTFIELAVSIAIIGVLSAVILSSVNGVRKSGRVAQRVADLKRVQAALDLYYAKNKSYPSTSSNYRSVCPAWGGYAASDVIPGLVPAYLTIMVNDPQTTAGSNNNCYIYISNGTDYAFIDYNVVELSNGSSGASYAKYPEFSDAVRPNASWKVSSPGGINF